jgi:hypothetical protein
MTETLYLQVTAITEEYLGPAAERFLARQITFHLGKSPIELQNEDIPMLIEWTRVTLGMLTEDREMIEEYAGKMAKLVQT